MGLAIMLVINVSWWHLGWLDASSHVENDVLMPDLGETADLCQPVLHLAVALPAQGFSPAFNHSNIWANVLWRGWLQHKVF